MKWGGKYWDFCHFRFSFSFLFISIWCLTPSSFSHEPGASGGVCHLLLFYIWSRPKYKQTKAVVRIKYKLPIRPLQAEACVFSGEHKWWLVVSEASSSPWEPCHAPVYHLLVLQTFSIQQTYEAPIPMVTEGRPRRCSPVRACCTQNSRTIYRCSHAPFSWHPVLLTFVFLRRGPLTQWRVDSGP